MNDERFAKLMQQHEGVGATSHEISFKSGNKTPKGEIIFNYAMPALASLGVCAIWYFCGMKNTELLSFAWLLVAYLIYQSIANEERNEKIEERLKDLRELIFNKDSFANACKLKAKYQAVYGLIQNGEISLGIDSLAAGEALKDKYKAIIESFNLQLGIDELDAIGVPYDKEELFINHTDQSLDSKKKFPTCLELISQNGILKNWKAYHMEPLELYELVEGFYSKDEKKVEANQLKPLTVSQELAVIVGNGPMSRADAVKNLWKYIAEHKLQDQANKRNINTDANLKKVFGGKSVVDMFEMTKLINKHLS